MVYGQNRVGVENKAELRTVVLASPDVHLRARVRDQLKAMRWHVREAGGGAEAMAQLESQSAEALVLDNVLPDLEVGEFARQMRSRHPAMDLLRVDGSSEEIGARSPRRNELLHALRQTEQDGRGAAEDELPAWVRPLVAATELAAEAQSSKAEGFDSGAGKENAAGKPEMATADVAAGRTVLGDGKLAVRSGPRTVPLPEMVGDSAGMQELARMVRLVAPRSSTVLIEGDTGTGKELVARAVHRLSTRAGKPLVVLNCAAIPESLLEAELFGHTRGAFTGAVQSRMGRIESANGGTLFLDEIGEMPLALQPKMLRFLESGELQRVGDNEMIHVNVRVIAATHQHLRQCAAERTFRLDLYHRLAVFPVSVPALKDRMEDVLPLAEYLLAKLGAEMPVKRLSADAAAKLMEYGWPGNVRELAHVLERGAILSEDRREIAKEEIRL